jgi:hypothetical protein
MDDSKKIQQALISAGVQRQQARRAAVIHRKKFMDGAMTPEEAHQRWGIPPSARCACGAKPLITCRIFMPLDEMVKANAEMIGRLLLDEKSAKHFMDQCIQTTSGVYVRTSTAYACKMHEKNLDQAAAKAPSWCIVEFNRGPGADKVVVGGPLTSAE